MLVSDSGSGNFRELFKGTLQGLAEVLIRLCGNLTSPHRCIKINFVICETSATNAEFLSVLMNFFSRVSYKVPWPIWRVINFLRWLLMETFQVLIGFAKKWDTGKASWSFSSVRYWPVTHVHTMGFLTVMHQDRACTWLFWNTVHQCRKSCSQETLGSLQQTAAVLLHHHIGPCS